MSEEQDQRRYGAKLVGLVAALALALAALLIFVLPDEDSPVASSSLSSAEIASIEASATEALDLSTNFGASAWNRNEESFMDYYRAVISKEADYWVSPSAVTDEIINNFAFADVRYPTDETSVPVYDYVDTVGRRSSAATVTVPDEYFISSKNVPTVVVKVAFTSTYHFYHAKLQEEGEWDNKSFVDEALTEPVTADFVFERRSGQWRIAEVSDVSAKGAFAFDTRFFDPATTDTPFTVPDHPIMSQAAIALGEGKGAPGYNREACILYGSACGDISEENEAPQYTQEAQDAYEEYMEKMKQYYAQNGN